MRNGATAKVAGDARKKLAAMANQAAAAASRSLQKLSYSNVAVGISNIEVQKVQSARTLPGAGRESLVAGIFLRLSGEISGTSLLVIPEEIAYRLCDLLFRREAGSTQHLTELDRSALMEVGNILCGSFLTVLSDTLKIKIIEKPPDFSFDMFGALMDSVFDQVGQGTGDVLTVTVTFFFGHTVVKGSILLLFGIENMAVILEALDKAEGQ